MDLVVTGSAKGHEVVPGMSAALGNRNLVVDFFHWNQSPFFQASFTKRVLGSVTIPDAFPCPTIFLVNIRGAFVLVVLPPCNSNMVLAILSVCQFGTGGIRARTLGSFGHLIHLLWSSRPTMYLKMYQSCSM